MRDADESQWFAHNTRLTYDGALGDGLTIDGYGGKYYVRVGDGLKVGPGGIAVDFESPGFVAFGDQIADNLTKNFWDIDWGVAIGFSAGNTAFNSGVSGIIDDRLCNANPQDVSSSPDPGTSNMVSRCDHVHAGGTSGHSDYVEVWSGRTDNKVQVITDWRVSGLNFQVKTIEVLFETGNSESDWSTVYTGVVCPQP